MTYDTERTGPPATEAPGPAPEHGAARATDTDGFDRDVPPAPRTAPVAPADRHATGAVPGDRHPAPAAPAAPAREQAASRTGGGQPGHEPLIPERERDASALRMRQAVSDFVEDPRHAVEEADRAFDSIVADLTEALDARRQALRASWQGPESEARTEELRVALQHYRDAGERLLRI
ncbi:MULTISPECIES: hypothetical protein [Streptomyces]|uniref:hypothetical protein n=1 Tax=Streptomyces TaxID=1883 RepID=UPI000CD4E03D|nr:MULTISPECIES: hypothetical protein [unclassified Streptomyces]AWL36788.1 hypothetical protein B9S64_00620 [Streptomyces sp. SM18]